MKAGKYLRVFGLGPVLGTGLGTFRPSQILAIRDTCVETKQVVVRRRPLNIRTPAAEQVRMLSYFKDWWGPVIGQTEVWDCMCAEEEVTGIFVVSPFQRLPAAFMLPVMVFNNVAYIADIPSQS